MNPQFHMGWNFFTTALSAVSNSHVFSTYLSRYSWNPNSEYHPSRFRVFAIDAMEALRNRFQLGRPMPLGLALCDFSTFKSTDPRDKVFALLGITTEGQRGEEGS